MTVLKGQAELDQYCLTKKEIAKELGISTNAVRCRMRSGNKDNLEYRFDGDKYLFKRPRVSMVNRPPSIRPPGRWNETNRKKKDWSKVNRGATHKGEGKYPNDAFRYKNEQRIMNVITKRVPQEVFDRNINKIALSEREYQRELLEKAQGNFKEPKYYGGLNPLNNRRYTQSYLADDQQRADTSFKPNKNFKYYDGGYSTPREDPRETVYTWSEPKVRDPGADYKPGKFKHLDDAIRKAKK